MIDLIAAYDVADDDRRSRLAALLSTMGVRIQLSVFQVQLPEADLDAFVAAIRSVVDENADLVQLLPRCAGCCGEAIDIGLARPDLDVGFWVV